MADNLYWATVSWDGYDEYTEGSFSFYRPTVEDLVDSVQDYLLKWKSRDAYLELASREYQGVSVEITDYIQSKINNKKEKTA